MGLCGCSGIDRRFDAKRAAQDVEFYRRKGPLKETRMLLDALAAQGLEGRTALDVGGGVGVFQRELLKAGVRSVTYVEASSAYVQAAKEQDAAHGFADRVAYLHGDFVELAPKIPPADIVVLDKVICCYEDVVRLVEASATLTKRWYAVVYPRTNWWVRMAFGTINLSCWARRIAFRTYVHPTHVIDSVLREQGLDQSFYGTTPVWQAAIYTRRVAGTS